MSCLAQLIKNNPAGLPSFKKPYIIAEAGVNHECDINQAFKLIDAAKSAGADAIKFQTYKADTLASKASPAYWDKSLEPTDSQYALFKKYDHFWKDEFVLLKAHCDKNEIEFLSTPFDVESASFLNDLMPVFKISSSDLNNYPFIKHICQYKKPIVLSTGASYDWEIAQAATWVAEEQLPLALLHCVLNYPTQDSNASLFQIKRLQLRYPHLIVGYSDHTLPKEMKTMEVAALLGAQIIEKHFTYNKSLPGNDHYHSMDEHDLRKFIASFDKTLELIGKQEFYRSPENSESLARSNARRSLVVQLPLRKGDSITHEAITWKRPGSGIDPRFYPDVIGMTTTKDLQPDTILEWKHLE